MIEFILVFIAIAVIILLILCVADLSTLLKLPALKLTTDGIYTEDGFFESLVLDNTGGRPLHNIVVKIQLDMYTEQNGMPVKLDLVERVVVDRLEIKKRKTIMILASDRSENTVGGISVVSIGGSEHTVAWKNDIYCGSITCSEDRISLVRKIAIERTRYSVHLHVFRF